MRDFDRVVQGEPDLVALIVALSFRGLTLALARGRVIATPARSLTHTERGQLDRQTAEVAVLLEEVERRDAEFDRPRRAS
jgi:hypothetical protein